nr:MAG TPA: hypothetical protein [Bacteriophage sp.]
MLCTDLAFDPCDLSPKKIKDLNEFKFQSTKIRLFIPF